MLRNPALYAEALDKMLKSYVPGLNARYDTTRFQAGDFRDYFPSGTMHVLIVGNITGRPVLGIDFFADTARNTGLVFYHVHNMGRPN